MTIKQRIKRILQDSREARNSDTELWLIYAQQEDLRLTERQKDIIRDMPSMETLRRTRQIIQNTEGSMRPDPTVDRARYSKYRAMRHNIHDEEPAQILQPGIPWVDYQP